METQGKTKLVAIVDDDDSMRRALQGLLQSAEFPAQSFASAEEFLKSGKLVPVQFSSRYYDFKRNKWVFGKANDEAIALLLTRKVFWHTRLFGGTVWIGDPTEALYLENTVEHVLEVARGLAESGLMTIEGEWASANAALMAQAEKFEADMKAARAALEKKHAFEDARRVG